LTPARHEEEEEHRHEEDVACGAGVRGEADGVVPEKPVDEARDDGHGDLADDVGGAEGEPAVDTAGVLAGLPESAVDVELGHDAVKDDRGDHDDQEDGEHAVLHVGDRVAEHPEGEPVEDTDDDADKQLSIVVRRVAPVLFEDTFREK
jgi:hypothetical protein